MSHNPFPDPAAVLPGEAEMLAAVLANLTDDLPKLVYADWLEERGDERGVFLREFTTAARNGAELPTASGMSKVWLDLTGCRAVAEARDSELPVTPDELLRDALPALTFTSEPAADADLLIGQSKFGGDPDVPPGFKWPWYRSRAHSFLAQFNLTRLSASPAARSLPTHGLLSVWYATDRDVFSVIDSGGWWVFHFPDLDHLERQPPLPEVEEDQRFYPARLTFTEALSLPNRLKTLDSTDSGIYQSHVYGPRLGHQLLGYPHWLQGEAPWAEEAEHGRSKHRHLLTIDTDNNPGWMWGDSGLLYFGVTADDLKDGRFDRTALELQGC